MEEISKPDATISEAENKNKKSRKPRTEAQMLAFKKCVENRKANIAKRKQGLDTNTSSTLHPENIIVKTVEQLKKQMEEQNRRMEEYKESIRREYEEKIRQNTFSSSSHDDQDVMMDTQAEDHHHHQQQMQQTRAQPVRFQHQHQPQAQAQAQAQNTYGHNHNQNRIHNVRINNQDDIAFFDPTSSVANTSRKRDVRGMDPYHDEKQGMLEKIYARNTNAYRQQLMEQQQKMRMASEDSIQILAPHQSMAAMAMEVDGSRAAQSVNVNANANANANAGDALGKEPVKPSLDRWDPVENMKAMIRGQKGKYIGFNGIASKFRR